MYINKHAPLHLIAKPIIKTKKKLYKDIITHFFSIFIYTIFRTTSKLISKSKSQSQLSSYTVDKSDNGQNNDVTIINNNDDHIKFDEICASALPGFLKGGVRRSLTQV